MRPVKGRGLTTSQATQTNEIFLQNAVIASNFCLTAFTSAAATCRYKVIS